MSVIDPGHEAPMLSLLIGKKPAGRIDGRGCQPQVPTTGQRNTQKVFGAVNIRRLSVDFVVGEAMFTGETYTAFLNSLAHRYR